MKSLWVHCPICNGKTRTRVYENTVLLNFPLYSPKCKKEIRINVLYHFNMNLSWHYKKFANLSKLDYVEFDNRLQRHWSKMNFGTDGIDMFKVLDTTRIYELSLEQGIEQSLVDRVKYRFIHAMDRDFLRNSLGGSSLELNHSDSPIYGYGSDPI